MGKKSINSNKQFMIGNGILAFGVFFIVCLFLYMGFRGQSKDPQQKQVFEGIYTIELADSFVGDSLSVYINDSLLLNRMVGNSAIKFQVERFAEESMLMVVDNPSENVKAFYLNPEGSRIFVSKRNGKVFIEEEEKP